MDIVDGKKVSNIPEKVLKNIEKHGEFIGKGSFGQVYKFHLTSEDVFAVKKISFDAELTSPDRVRREVNIHSKLVHENIVKYFGCFPLKDGVCIILEYMVKGSLKRKLKILDKNYGNQPTKPLIDGNEIPRHVSDIVAGLQFLHIRKIIHRDLRAANVLLNLDDVAKISDFGISKELDELKLQTGVSTYTSVSTSFWTAPELADENDESSSDSDGTDETKKKRISSKVDIWALGVLIQELVYHVPPFMKHNYNNLIKNIKKGQTPIPDFVTEPIQNLIKMCMTIDPSNRPDAKELAQFLKQVCPSKEDREENERRKLEKQMLRDFNLEAFINNLDHDNAEQATGLALKYDFTKLQMSILHSYNSGRHKQQEVFLNALHSLAIPFDDIMEACEEADMPQTLIVELIKLKEERQLFSELRPAQYHSLSKHLVGDPRNPAIKTWRNIARCLPNQGMDILQTIDGTVARGAIFSAGYYVMRVLTERGETVEQLRLNLVQMEENENLFSTVYLQRLLDDAVEKKRQQDERMMKLKEDLLTTQLKREDGLEDETAELKDEMQDEKSSDEVAECTEHQTSLGKHHSRNTMVKVQQANTHGEKRVGDVRVKYEKLNGYERLQSPKECIACVNPSTQSLVVISGLDDWNIHIYNLTTSTWSTTSTSGDKPIWGSDSGWFRGFRGWWDDQRVWVLSNDLDNDDRNGSTSISLFTCNINTGTWVSMQQAGRVPTPRIKFALWQRINDVVIFGGKSINMPPDLLDDEQFVQLGKQNNQVFILNCTTEPPTWSHPQCTGTRPSPRLDFAYTQVNNIGYLFGGVLSGLRYMNDLFSFNLDTWQWTPITTDGNVPSPRGLSAMASMNNEELFLCGGCNGLFHNMTVQNDCYILHLRPMRWEKVEVPNLEPVCMHTLTQVEEGKMMLIGPSLNGYKNVWGSVLTKLVGKLFDQPEEMIIGRFEQVYASL